MSFESKSSESQSPVSGLSDTAALDTNQVLDTSGLYCPEPVMLLHNKIRDIGSGELLRVIATDPSTQRDIPKFCTFLGHTLEAQDVADGIFTYFIRKA